MERRKRKGGGRRIRVRIGIIRQQRGSKRKEEIHDHHTIQSLTDVRINHSYRLISVYLIIGPIFLLLLPLHPFHSAHFFSLYVPPPANINKALNIPNLPYICCPRGRMCGRRLNITKERTRRKEKMQKRK